MRCARCGNEVFRISARYGESSFYCARCGLAHPLQPEEFGTRIEADHPIRICMSRRPPEVTRLQKGAGRSDERLISDARVSYQSRSRRFSCDQQPADFSARMDD